MQIYPFSYPIILNDDIFTQYGGKTGTFTRQQLDASFQIAEQQTSNYIGTLLLPHIITGTYTTPLTHTQRVVTDYGYVSQILDVIVDTQKVTQSGGAELLHSDGAAFIYSDTFGYLDIYKLASTCGLRGGSPYQYQIVYEAGLPTGTANLPAMLMAMTMAAQITLNEMFPGVVGTNEGVGDVGIQEFESFAYHERRTAHSLKRTAFGGSAMASKISSLIDSCVRKARRSLRVS